ncbi:RDD family protein [Vineibacter terrae]|uniref:RDD family protein n=1 Tax=Vineibacter terrae TaxID=2586908 RepID=UPI002E34ED9C|nr:RDD family protein [Vineibacter terrae]HEX2885111.1 RDD family protein [Vineibacter terrae]
MAGGRSLSIPAVVWRRLAAGLVDALLLVPPTLLIIWLTGDKGSLTPVAALLVSLLDLVYRAGLESSRWRATLGKRWLGLAVGTLAGERLSVERAVVRTLPFWGGTLVAVLTPVLGTPLFSLIAWLVAPACLLWLPRTGWRQALHDQWAGARVAMAAAPPTPAESASEPPVAAP